MAETDPNETHGTQNWYVTYQDQDYPLKHTVGRAISPATSAERREGHTRKCIDLVEQLGFSAIKKE